MICSSKLISVTCTCILGRCQIVVEESGATEKHLPYRLDITSESLQKRVDNTGL